MENIKNEAATLHRFKPDLNPLVVPIAKTEKIIAAWQSFQELKTKLLDDSDYVEIQNERYGKKSAFRKLALAFGISTDIIREERLELKNGFAYEITIKASAPSKRFMTAVASCHSNERQFNKDSDVRAIAQTRATNRAIADIIGWSAPSAEEMMTDVPVTEENSAPETNSTSDWFEKIASNPAKNQEQGAGHLISEKQRNLLVSLINERIIEPEERENQLQLVDSLTKSEAHHLISNFLENKY